MKTSKISNYPYFGINFENNIISNNNINFANNANLTNSANLTNNANFTNNANLFNNNNFPNNNSFTINNNFDNKNYNPMQLNPNSLYMQKFQQANYNMKNNPNISQLNLNNMPNILSLINFPVVLPSHSEHPLVNCKTPANCFSYCLWF